MLKKKEKKGDGDSLGSASSNYILQQTLKNMYILAMNTLGEKRGKKLIQAEGGADKAGPQG
jgi:hypothetical protein